MPSPSWHLIAAFFPSFQWYMPRPGVPCCVVGGRTDVQVQAKAHDEQGLSHPDVIFEDVLQYVHQYVYHHSSISHRYFHIQDRDE